LIKLYHAPMTRSTRVRWLLEELGVPYELETIAFEPPEKGFFAQKTPLGKLPVIEDDGVVFAESGAIVEYLVERYGEGRLAPAVGDPARGPYLQWVHFSEGTLYPPIGTIVFHTFYRKDASEVPSVIEDARGRALSALDFLREHKAEGPWVMGDDFTAADVMLGYSLAIARFVQVLEKEDPLAEYLDRLEARPAFERSRA
jgi:glutathione S-transferase